MHPGSRCVGGGGRRSGRKGNRVRSVLLTHEIRLEELRGMARAWRNLVSRLAVRGRLRGLAP